MILLLFYFEATFRTEVENTHISLYLFIYFIPLFYPVQTPKRYYILWEHNK
jgi:hypothetical protein